MADSLQFAWRTQKAIGVTDAAPLYAPLSGFAKAEGAHLRCSAYSPCGRFFAYSANDRVDIVDASQGHVLTTLNLPWSTSLPFLPAALS
jgi:translation initiation factor 2A